MNRAPSKLTLSRGLGDVITKKLKSLSFKVKTVLILSNYYIFLEYNDMVLINFFVKSTINMKE